MTPGDTHESLHQALVERIVTDLRPVRRLQPVRVRLALWIALEAAVLLLVIWHGARHDLGEQLRNPGFLLGVLGFALAGAVGAALALRAAIPGREPAAGEFALLTGLAIASALSLLWMPVDVNLSVGSFIRTGLPCVVGIAVFALVPWLTLLWAVRRAAPMAPASQGALAGAAAFLFSFAVMRLKCPIDDRMHLLVWHLLPVLAGIGLSACAGMVWLKRRRSR
jgi:hypothetical protein